MKILEARSLVLTAILARTVSAQISDDRFVVTDLGTVEASSRQEALDLCQRGVAGGLSVGVDWGTGPNGGQLHLCQVRTPIDAVKDDTRVLQRLAVFDGAACPYEFKILATPRSGVVVCAGYASSAKDAIVAGDFISDLAVTSERNYNNDRPGWTTVPYSLHTSATAPSPANRGVFLSYRQPVRPITALQVLKDVDASSVASVCGYTLGLSWRPAGVVGFIDQADNATAKTVLCTKRELLSSSIVLLTDVALVDASQKCSSDSQLLHPLSDSAAVCSKWTLAERVTPFIADLDLHRVTTALGESTNPAEPQFLPGAFDLVANRNLNTASDPVYLFSRKWQPQTTSPTPALSKPPLTATVDEAGKSLRFKILQLADLHYTGDPKYACRDAPTGWTANCTEAVMTKWVNDLLDVEKPDFVAFTGDNVETFTASRRQAAMDIATSGVEARGIPYGMVFGNHDDENGFPREEIVKIAASKAHSYTQRGPIEVDGVGNYELGVQAPVDGPWGARGSDVFRMYFLDSHGYPDRTKYPLVSSSYDWVKPNQIEYYRNLSAAHAAANNTVPAVMFFHIPLVEYAANAASKTNGEQYESVASSDVSTNLFSTLVDLGEVKATFVGHDHVNDYCYKRQGVQLCYGGGAGFGRAYGSSTFARRARAIEWTVDEHGKRAIRSWKRRFGELSSRWLEETLFEE